MSLSGNNSKAILSEARFPVISIIELFQHCRRRGVVQLTPTTVMCHPDTGITTPSGFGIVSELVIDVSCLSSRFIREFISEIYDYDFFYTENILLFNLYFYIIIINLISNLIES